MPDLPPFPPESDETPDSTDEPGPSSFEDPPESGAPSESLDDAVEHSSDLRDDEEQEDLLGDDELLVVADSGEGQPEEEELTVDGDATVTRTALEDLRQQIITRLGETQQSLLGLIEHFQAEHQHAAAEAEARHSELEQQLEALKAEQQSAAADAEADRLQVEQALEAAQARLVETEQTLESERQRAAETLSQAESASGPATGGPAIAATSLFALRHSIAALDAGSTQTEVLSRLVEEATGLAGRAALLLPKTDSQSLSVWNASGFGDALEAGADAHPPASLQRALEGRPVRGDEARWEVDDLAPDEAVAIPLILRDTVRAVLYADRTEDAQPFDSDALQILTYCAAEALETLPLRSLRPAGTLVDPTPSLTPTTEAPEEEPVPILETAETGAVAEQVHPAVAEEAEAPEIEALDAGSETADLVAEPEPVEPELEAEPVEAEPAESAVESQESADTLELELEEEPPTLEAPSEELVDVEPETPGWELHEEAEPESQASPLASVPALPDVEDEPAEPVPASDAPIEAEDQVEAPVEGVEPTSGPTLVADVAAEEEEDEDSASTEFKTQAVQLDQIPAAPPATSSSANSPEVVPPSDVQGPGWAFTGSALGESPAANEDPMHEEARRLARLLVSEIKLYNEEQIDEGKRQGNIYRFLKEPIDRSRVLYEERIDERVRADTDYYEDELVRSLANGDRGLLGL